MKIDTLFLDARLTIDDEIAYLLDRVNLPYEMADSLEKVYNHVLDGPDPIARGKKTLYITRNRGAVIKPCPGTRHYSCCDYTILHTGTFCTMDCAYCILQAYFHPPVLQYFAGLDLLSKSLAEVFDQHKVLRIGTGEFTDSLIWEPVSMQPAFLVNAFAGQTSCVLELKTKTTCIDSLLPLTHNRKTILSWSLNTPRIIHSQERGTSSLTARLQAARKAEAAGYPVAFHFDPIVVYEGCQAEYCQTISRIFDYVSADNICWISMGSFRFMPQLKQIIEKRFPESNICYHEFIHGLDNKLRYFKPIRMEIYRAMIECLRHLAPDVLAYFCMEDQTVWEQCMGFFFETKDELGQRLDDSAIRHCGLDPALMVYPS